MTDLVTRSTLPTDLHTILTAAAGTRANQLAALPFDDADLVARAHRASVKRILDEIHSALDRLDAGTYGECVACSRTIPIERLERLLWSSHCARCASL
ncbi:MAG: hypothetical protein WB471_10530 [Nocardioides sp.]